MSYKAMCKVCFNETFELRGVKRFKQTFWSRSYHVYCSKCETIQTSIPIPMTEIHNNAERETE
jgi:hypothetical protein